MGIVRIVERQLRSELAVVNGLNVFPVPDGDTGTNMLATINEALLEAEQASTLSEASRLLASGAMLGARGNSGVILSQLFQAVSDVLQDKADVTEFEVTAILSRAADLAYKTVTHPQEGTMLSVMSAAAQAARNALGKQSGRRFMETILEAAAIAVARTPEQLAILREAQVVDAGGYGFLLLLRGSFEGITGQPAPSVECEFLGMQHLRERLAHGPVHPSELVKTSDTSYGCCVTVLVECPPGSESAARSRLEELGDSVLVVAAGGRLKLHLHVPDPEVVLAYAAELGTVGNVEISNIDEQTSAPPGVAAVLAVAPGEGLRKIFRTLGAAATLLGGPTQNPSTAELANAARALDQAPAVFLLPNNGNILAAARQAAGLEPRLRVIPSTSIPQGVAALLAFNENAGVDENIQRMTAALTGVVSAELVPAAREALINGVSVRTGDMMALVEGRLVGAGPDALAELLKVAEVAKRELATVYYGAAVTLQEAEGLRDSISRLAPNLEVELVRGDQPQAHYLLSLE